MKRLKKYYCNGLSVGQGTTLNLSCEERGRETRRDDICDGCEIVGSWIKIYTDSSRF